MDHLISEQKIDLPYVYTAGAMQRAGLIGLREGRLVGASGGDHVVVPARPFGPDGTWLTEAVELPDEGVLEALTVASHLPGSPTYGLIRIEGATTLLLHRLADGAEVLQPGAAVRAVWRDERVGAIDDIEHWAPA
jgi:uncharacterized OB-fold protein